MIQESSHTVYIFILYALVFCYFWINIEKTNNIKDYIVKRVKRLYIPYLLLALIFSLGSYKSIALVFYGSCNALQVAGSSTPLWFLPCLLVADILFQLLLQIFSNKENCRKLLLLIPYTIVIVFLVVFFEFVKLDWGCSFFN